jgi:hypothetical protein
MAELVPLFQTTLWIGLILYLIRKLLPELDTIRRVITKRLEAGSLVEVGPIKIGELREEVRGVKEQLSEVNGRVTSLFLTTMAPNMYLNLKKLSSGAFGKYTKTKGLERELYHLRDIGYIEIRSITAIPEEGDDLSQYVAITSTGAQFVELREKIEQDLNVI